MLSLLVVVKARKCKKNERKEEGKRVGKKTERKKGKRMKVAGRSGEERGGIYASLS